jgi:poly(3-hydroxybutyrate) depolymerase
MKTRSSVTLLILALAALSCAPAQADVLKKSMTLGKTIVYYRVVLPKDYDPGKAYPAILGFGGGPQTLQTVDSVIDRNFRDEAEKRGYIVIVPAAPNGHLFFDGGERIIPDFLKQIMADYKIRDGKFHIAGVSNGGISSFHVASVYPQYFVSITAFPGYLWEDTPEHEKAISKMCIAMFVGEVDPMGWQPLMQKQTARFREQGMHATYTEEKGQPHRIETLAGPASARLFDLFDAASHGCGN